jgi:putative PIG3 family NAD(P)H quinone oxidoreductase
MRVVEICGAGGPEMLRIAERPIPKPSPGEVLIAVKAAGVTRADSMQRQGKYPPPPGAPDIPGLEVAGIEQQTGNPVCALLNGGGYAEYAVAPSAHVLPIPKNWNFIEAATLPENMFTVYDNLFTRAAFRAAQSLLIHGGSSGVGTTAIMLAREFGASFIAVTAGSDAKCAACRALGADLAINYKDMDFVAEIQAATRDRGVDVILDMVGGDYIPRDIQALAADGRIVCIATPRGSSTQVDIRALLQRRAAIMASALRPRSIEEKGAIGERLLQEVWPRLPARQNIRPVVDSVFALEDAAEAHRRLDASAHIGKIVLEI